MPHVHGWTVMETLMVLAIASILAVAASGPMGRTLEAIRSQTEIHRLTASLALARNLAITRRTHVVVCPSQDGSSCSGSPDWSAGWLVILDPDGLGQPRSERDVLDARQRGRGAANIRVLTSSGRSHVRFQPNGAAGGTNLTLSLCSAQGNRRLGQVIVSRTGRARSLRDAGNQAAEACASRA